MTELVDYKHEGSKIRKVIARTLSGQVNLTENKKSETLSLKQKALLDFMKKIGYGKIEVIINDGEPQFAIKKEETYKFG